MKHRHVLARSDHYEVTHEFEVVFLSRFTTPAPDVVIGDFYGDPVTAIIDKKERFVIMIGCGMIIYNLKEPFQPYQYNLKTSQWKELFREVESHWWIESIIQTGENTFHFTVDPNSNEALSYELTFPEWMVSVFVGQ